MLTPDPPSTKTLVSSWFLNFKCMTAVSRLSVVVLTSMISESDVVSIRAPCYLYFLSFGLIFSSLDSIIIIVVSFNFCCRPMSVVVVSNLFCKSVCKS